MCQSMNCIDQDKRNRMIVENQNLIYAVLKKLNLYNDRDNYFDVGMIGLIKAVDTFDETKSSKATYFYKCIMNEIFMTLRKKKINCISLNQEINENGDTLEAIISDSDDFTKQIDKDETLNDIYKAIHKLKNREKECIIRHFGLLNNKQEKQIDIAKSLNMTQATVSRIITRAIKKIRKEVFYE